MLDLNHIKIDKSIDGIVLLSFFMAKLGICARRYLIISFTAKLLSMRLSLDVDERQKYSCFSNVYEDMITLIPTKQNVNEIYRDSKSIFSAQIFRLSSFATHTTILDLVSALIAFANENVETNGRLFIIVGSSPYGNLVRTSPSTNHTLKLTKYESVAAVLRPCDCQ